MGVTKARHLRPDHAGTKPNDKYPRKRHTQQSSRVRAEKLEGGDHKPGMWGGGGGGRGGQRQEGPSPGASGGSSRRHPHPGLLPLRCQGCQVCLAPPLVALSSCAALRQGRGSRDWHAQREAGWGYGPSVPSSWGPAAPQCIILLVINGRRAL